HQGRRLVDLNLTESGTYKVLDLLPPQDKAKPHEPGSALSERETEVLKLLAQGHTNQQVADRLFLSVKTIETYRARIGEKLGLRSRADLVRYALELGLLKRDDPTSKR